MHIQHDEAPSASPAEHVIDMHAASSSHDTIYDTHHQDDSQGHYHPAEIDISSDGLVNKAEFFKLFILLFIILSIIWIFPQLRRVPSRHHLKTKLASLNYLLYPPLRAPPK